MMSSVFYARSIFSELGFVDEPRYSARFATGVDYKRSLFASDVDRTRLRAFCENLPLPRYIAVASVFDGEQLICDFVSDVSDAAHLQNDDRLLAIVGHAVCAESKAAQWLEATANSLSVPTLFAPPAPLGTP